MPFSRTLPLLMILLLLTACGGEKKPQQDPDVSQKVNIPLSSEQGGMIKPVEVPAEKLPDLSKLSEVEAAIFKRTIALLIPYYDLLEKWADNANKITKGDEAAASLRQYLNIQNEFTKVMQRMDLEFAGKIDPNYAGSPAFDKAIDQYMSDGELVRRTDYVLNSFASLLKKFETDPACKDLIASIQRMASESQ